MRERLRELEGQLGTYWGTFVQRSQTKGRKKIQTWLLRDVKDSSGEIVADHLWVKPGSHLRRQKPYEGDTIEFAARVYAYGKLVVRTSGLEALDDYSFEGFELRSIFPSPQRIAVLAEHFKDRDLVPVEEETKRQPERLIPASELFSKRVA